MTIGAALALARDDLGARGVESPDVDAEFLLGRVLGLTRTELTVARERELTLEEEAAFGAIVERRGRREPLAYVLGEWGLRRLTLATDSRALVPRPETEVVVERCLALLGPIARPAVLDLGTGAGAIALAIADEHPGARIVAVDNSADALALTRENMERTNLVDRVDLVHADLDQPPGADFDLVVSNPPYVLPEEFDDLPPEVKDWEPVEALVSTVATDKAVATAARVLRGGGFTVLEAADGRASKVAHCLLTHSFTGVTISPDLAGRERVVEGRRP